MKIAFLVILLTLTHTTFSQTHSLLLKPECENLKSPFTKVQVISNLQDGQPLGFIQKGAFNKRQEIIYEGSLSSDITKFFTSNQSSTAGEKQLIVVLNQLFMSETTGDFSETGRLKISLRLFSNLGAEAYSEILNVDSIYTFKGMDVTKRLLNSVNEQFCQIGKAAITEGLKSHENQRIFSLDQLSQLDSLEKLDIPMYTVNTPKMGIYKDFKHLKLNTPDDSSQIIVDAENPSKVKVYKVYRVKNRKIMLEPEGIYAVSDGEKLYKATSKSYYRIKKRGADFYYDRPASITESNPAAIAGAAAFGMMGALLMSGGSEGGAKWYRFKINHRKGNSVLIAEVE